MKMVYIQLHPEKNSKNSPKSYQKSSIQFLFYLIISKGRKTI